jgi:hypothetical protein
MSRPRGKNPAQRKNSVRRLPANNQARRRAKTPAHESELGTNKNRYPLSGESIPIEDPFLEKEIFETQGENGYAMYLVKDRPQGIAFPGGLGQRLSEVYRRCYEARKDFTVIRDFVAYLPGLAFNSRWLAALVKDHTIFEDPSPGSPRNRLLRALAYGFKGAADPKPRYRRWSRANRLLAARDVQRAMQKEFADSFKPNSIESIDVMAKQSRVAEIVNKVIKIHRVLKPQSEELAAHLMAGQFRKASVLFASKIFRVLAHDLESKPSLSKTRRRC